VGHLPDEFRKLGNLRAIFYVQVKDAYSAIERAQQLGATIVVPVIVVPVIDNGIIQFAHLADPLGNCFGIWATQSPPVVPTGQSPTPSRLPASGFA
jgi:predicted enzyme related to lactoylglutathione lyase